MSVNYVFLNAFFDGTTLLLAAPGNIFILLVNAMDVVHAHKLQFSDQLICSICAFNILCLLSNVVQSAFVLLWGDHQQVNQCLQCLRMMFVSSSAGFSMWLCMFFCLKIVTINNKMYIYMQRTFPKTFTRLFIFTLLGSFIESVFSVWKSSEDSISNATSSPCDWKVPLTLYDNCDFSVEFDGSLFALAFGILLTTGTIITISLYKHLRRMKANAVGSGTASMEAHVHAVKIILSLLLVNILNVIARVQLPFLVIRQFYLYIRYICTFLSYVLSPFVLIRGNKKLNKAINVILHCYDRG